MKLNLNEKQKREILMLARIPIADELDVKLSYKESMLDFSAPLFTEKLGAFVTLHLNGRLRGCIGYIVGVKDVVQTIKDMAYSAAFRDPRFPPLKKEEFEEIDLEISLLSPISKVTSIEGIEVGRDGLIVSTDGASGLLLPQVATENGWSREEFLEHTCQKAGLPRNAWKKSSVIIEKFSAYVFGELHND